VLAYDLTHESQANSLRRILRNHFARVARDAFGWKPRGTALTVSAISITTSGLVPDG